MNTCSKFLAILLFSLVSSFVSSQNQYSKWYFGQKAAIDFMTTPPTPLFNSAMSTTEGCSSIADAAGNLLFYTDGMKVWNSQHMVMTNGTGLTGSFNSAQSALIVKQPGNTNIYYIFTTDALGNPAGLRYSIVNMSLSGGLGSVTTKNILLYAPTTERMCGLRHCNRTDVWVITHDHPGSTFYAHLITSAGVNATPVLSTVGAALTSTNNSMGYLKASPSGRKLITTFESQSQSSAFELYDFDNATGVISNPLSFSIPIGDGEFSPDGTKLYMTEVATVTAPLYQILQMDLCAGNPAAMVASIYTISCPLSWRMQTAIDGKIYVTELIGQDLGVINNPNAAGAACGYVPKAISIAPNNNSASLNGFVTERIPTPFTYTNLPAGCNTASFNVSNCPILNTNITNIVWDFGDPASGTNNTSTLFSPTHTYSGPGTYTARAIYYYPCGTDTARQQVVIAAIPLSASSQSICTGQSATLIASGNTSYTWNTASNTSSISVSPMVTTIYTVTGTAVSGCTNSATSTVVVNPLPTLSITGNAKVCAGESATLGGNGANSYTWSTGAQGPGLTVFPVSEVTYTLYGTNNFGCVSQKTIQVSIRALPVISVSGEKTLCLGSAAVQTATGALTYSWSSGETINSVSLSPVANSVYSVAGKNVYNCVGSGTFELLVIPIIPLNVIPNLNIAPGSSVVLQVSGGVNYTWSPADHLSCINCDAPVASPPDAIQYCVSSLINNCKSEACTDITVSCESGNDLSLPNAFTPNGDGNNDVFCIQGWDHCITDFEIMIFNRWGENVFTSTDRSFCWDGISKGSPLPADVFVYIVKATFNGKTLISKRGNISLLR